MISGPGAKGWRIGTLFCRGYWWILGCEWNLFINRWTLINLDVIYSLCYYINSIN